MLQGLKMSIEFVDPWPMMNTPWVGRLAPIWEKLADQAADISVLFCLISRFPHSHCYQEPQTIIFNGCLNGETTISHVKICNHPIETTIRNWLFWVPGKSCFFVDTLSAFSCHGVSSSFGQDWITVNQAITSQTQVQTLEVSQDWPVKIADVLPASLEIASRELSLSKKPFHRNINLYQALSVRGRPWPKPPTDFNSWLCQVDCTVSKTICEKANIKASDFSLVTLS